jgi:hypothetical protein
MRRLSRYLSAFLLFGFMVGGPVGYALADAGVPCAEDHRAGGHDGHGDAKPDHEPVGHGPLHCLFASCVPTLFASVSGTVVYDFSASAGFSVRTDNDAPRSAVPERDPPVPRFSI